MTFVIGDIKHANLVDFLLSQLGYSVPCADDTNRLQRLRVYVAFSFVQADRNQPQREISAPCLTLSSQMRWPKLCGCLCSSLAHGFPSSKPFSDKNYLCSSKSGSPNSKMNLKNKEMNRSGSRRRKEGGRRRVAANPITVAAKWFVPLGEQQIKKRCLWGRKDGEELLWGGGWQYQELSSLIFPLRAAPGFLIDSPQSRPNTT